MGGYNNIPDGTQKLLIVEGKDEVICLACFIEHLGIQKPFIIDAGGNEQFKNRFPVIKNDPNFENINVLGIIRDCETNAAAAFQSITAQLQKHGLNVPRVRGEFEGQRQDSPVVGVFLTPNNSDTEGQLENLFITSLEGCPSFPCMESYVNCLSENLLPTNGSAGTEKNDKCCVFPKNLHKAKARALLAALHEDVKDLGTAAQKKYWNIDHACFDDLKKFLSDFHSF